MSLLFVFKLTATDARGEKNPSYLQFQCKPFFFFAALFFSQPAHVKRAYPTRVFFPPPWSLQKSTQQNSRILTLSECVCVISMFHNKTAAVGSQCYLFINCKGHDITAWCYSASPFQNELCLHEICYRFLLFPHTEELQSSLDLERRSKGSNWTYIHKIIVTRQCKQQLCEYLCRNSDRNGIPKCLQREIWFQSIAQQFPFSSIQHADGSSRKRIFLHRRCAVPSWNYSE